MKKIFYLMAMAIVALTFSACSDDENFLAEVNYPQEATGGKMVVDAWANNFPLEIKSEGAWRVESDSFFFTVEPEDGNGNATVTVSVQNNTRSKRKTGHLTIVFPEHEGQNKVLTIEQKWQGEYGENADILDKQNIIYAVGYGFDTTKGLYPNSDCLRAEIFNTSKLISEGTEGTGELKMNATLSTVTGNSITELSNKLTVKANASGGIGKFKAEANASFTMDYTNNSNHEYAINYLEATLATARLNKGVGRLKTRRYMNEEAYEDINGIFEDYAQVRPDGTLNKDWAKNLIRDYGTHVVMTARLGGRVRQSLDVDISDIKESYDLNVFAKASYEGVLAKAGGSVNDDFHKSYNNHKNSMKINVDALGGDTKLAKALVAKDGFTEANYLAWFNSVDKDNMALMGFVDENSLVPLYDLVDQSATVEKDGFDGKKRYEALYNYMTGGEAARDYEDNSTYDTGTVTAFDVPTFSTDYNATLVKDIKLGGQIVGQVCEEYIPAINRDKRVIVIYPVIGTTVRYNMGFFIGDDTHKPARVAWNGTETNIVEYADLDFGQVSKLYLRGASITATAAEGAAVKQGTLEDELLVGKIWNGSTNIPGSYPLVKIFNHIWTRRDFSMGLGEGSTGNYVDGTYHVYYNYDRASQADQYPAGWRVAKSSDYSEMKSKLGANGHSLPGLALLKGGVTGYEVVWAGWHDLGYGWGEQYRGGNSQMEYRTSDDYHIRIQSSGTFDIEMGTHHENWLMCLRLVKE